MNDIKWTHQFIFIYLYTHVIKKQRKSPLCRSKSLFWNGKGSDLIGSLELRLHKGMEMC